MKRKYNVLFYVSTTLSVIAIVINLIVIVMRLS